MNMMTEEFLKKETQINNSIKNMCGLEGMKQMKDKTVNAVISDCPYGIADATKLTKIGNKFVSTNEAWGNDFKDSWANIDEYYEWLKPFITEWVRLLKDDGSMILFLDRKYTGFIIYKIEKDFGLLFKNKIYFTKSNPLPSCRKTNYRSSCEEAIYFTKSKQFTFNFGEQKDMTQVYSGSIGHGKTTKHPTEKYSWMLTPLIKNHTNEGDVILDCFAGSGSTLYQAIKLNRKAIGFEKNKDFHEMAKTHFIEKQMQLDFE